MDKLKPVLNHIFWILFGIALLLPVIGWFLGTGTLSAAIDQRISTLNGLNPTPGSTVPNDGWIEKAAEVKEERKTRLDTAADFLWEQQQKYMTWHPRMRREVEGKIFEDDIDISGLNTYRSIFDRQVENELRQIVDPYEWDQNEQKFVGKVLLDPGVLPLPQAAAAWPSGPPASKEVWYLQEDFWLLRGLLESVRDINDRAGANANIIKVPIKQITSIELMGGNPEALEALASGGAAAAGGYGSGGYGGAPDPGMGPPPGMMSGAMGGAVGGTLDFNIAEEVGPATAAAGTAAGGYGDAGGYGSGGGVDAMSTGMPSPYGMGADANSILNEKRYVDEFPPYKTRAFKMSVIMDHRQLPEFLVELTNSPFPVRIVRVHWAELNQDPNYGGTSSSYATGGGYSEMGDGLGSGFGSGRGFGASRGAVTPRAPSFGGASRGGGFGRMPAAPRAPFGGATAMPPIGGARGPVGTRGPGILSPAIQGADGYGYGSGSGMPGQAGQAGGGDVVATAMADPFLAQVVIGGVMTIYRSPEEQARVAAGGTEGESPADDAAATDPAVDPAAAGGEAALPADGSEPVDGAPADGTGPMPAGPAEETDPLAPTDGTGAPIDAGAAPPATPEAGEAAPVDPAATDAAPAGSAAPGGPAPDAAAETGPPPESP